MNLKTANNICRAVNVNTSFKRGKGYFYFVYDDGDIFESRSVMTASIASWSDEMMRDEAQSFLEWVEDRA